MTYDERFPRHSWRPTTAKRPRPRTQDHRQETPYHGIGRDLLLAWALRHLRTHLWLKCAFVRIVRCVCLSHLTDCTCFEVRSPNVPQRSGTSCLLSAAVRRTINILNFWRSQLLCCFLPTDCLYKSRFVEIYYYYCCYEESDEAKKLFRFSKLKNSWEWRSIRGSV